MIKNIVFDMGNVLVQYNPDHFMRELSPEERALFNREIYHSEDWWRLDHGDLTEEELIDLVCGRIPAQYHETAKRLIRWYDLSAPIEGMEALICKLKERGYSIYLLSNTSLAFRSFYRCFPALAHFDDYFISAEHRLLKPDPAIYQRFCETVGVKPQESVFVDDRSDNVAAASALGFTAIQFDGNAQALQNALTRLQILS